MGAGDGFFQEAQVPGEGEGTLLDGDVVAVDLFDGGEQEDAGGVASSGQEGGVRWCSRGGLDPPRG